MIKTSLEATYDGDTLATFVKTVKIFGVVVYRRISIPFKWHKSDDYYEIRIK